MGLLKNKKGVEGLPFKYIIIALVAALVIGMVLNFTNILGEGTIGAAERISESLEMRTICELDEEDPVIRVQEIICVYDDETKNLTITVDVEDECGVDSVWFYNEDDKVSITLRLTEGTKREGTWSATEELDYLIFKGAVFARDEAVAGNLGVENVEFDCEQYEGDD